MSCGFLMGKKQVVVWNSLTLNRHLVFIHQMTSTHVLSIILTTFVASFCLSAKQCSSSHLKVVPWYNQDMLGHNAAGYILIYNVDVFKYLNTI